MKKYLIIAVLLFLPLITHASFDTNLKYGNKGQSVKEVQEFLTDQGVYSGPITGNFYSLTLRGVKNFQNSQGLRVSGIWGIDERTKANELTELGSDNTVALDTPSNEIPNGWHFSGTSTPTIIINIPTSSPVIQPMDVCANLEGIQTTIPLGMENQNGNCVSPIPQPQTPKASAPALLPPLSSDDLIRFDCFSLSTNSARCEGSGPLSASITINFNGQVVWDGSKPYGGVQLQTNSSGGMDIPDTITNLNSKTTYQYQIVYKESGREDTIINKSFTTN